MKYISLLIILLCSTTISAQNNQYLGQKPPGMTPQKFAPGIISNDYEYEFGSVFSRDGLEFYYGVAAGPAEIRYLKFENGAWTKPDTILSHTKYGMNDPFLTPDEQRLFYISKKALSGDTAKADHDIWYSEKTEQGWSEPINAGPNINTTGNEYYISFTNDGTMYFSSNINAVEDNWRDNDIYYSKFVNGEFQKPVRLGPAINTKWYEADVYVAPDESYLIFAAARPKPEGRGQGDLYISFKNEDGTWTKSKNMGDVINTTGHELCPFVTADGKYFMYTSNQDIYWVDAKIIEQLR